MKKLIFLLLLIPAFSFGQSFYAATKQPSQFSYIKIDSGGLALPLGDTVLGRGTTRPGSLVCRSADSAVYRWTGLQWVLMDANVSSFVAKLNSKVDSITYVNPYLTYWKNGISYGFYIFETLQQVTSFGPSTSNDVYFNSTAHTNQAFKVDTDGGDAPYLAIMQADTGGGTLCLLDSSQVDSLTVHAVPSGKTDLYLRTNNAKDTVATLYDVRNASTGPTLYGSDDSLTSSRTLSSTLYPLTFNTQQFNTNDVVGGQHVFNANGEAGGSYTINNAGTHNNLLDIDDNGLNASSATSTIVEGLSTTLAPLVVLQAVSSTGNSFTVGRTGYSPNPFTTDNNIGDFTTHSYTQPVFSSLPVYANGSGKFVAADTTPVTGNSPTMYQLGQKGIGTVTSVAEHTPTSGAVSLSTLTNGFGILGSPYDGSANQLWLLDTTSTGVPTSYALKDSLFGFLRKSNNLSDLTSTESAKVNLNIKSTTTAGTATYAFFTNELIESITIIEPTSISVAIGTTMGGHDIINNWGVSGRANITVNYSNATGGTLYFTGLTSNSIIKIYKR